MKYDVYINNAHDNNADYIHNVHGSVTKKDAVIQLLVLSADAQWYLQKDVIVEKHRWHTTVCLGYPDSTGPYYVVAFLQDDHGKFPVSPLTEIPTDRPISNVAIYVRK